MRAVGLYLVFVAIGLTLVWLGMCGAYAFAGRRRCAAVEAPGVGYLIVRSAAIQGALYPLLLSVISAIAISRGVAAAPGAPLFWGLLALFTTLAALVLLRSASGRLPTSELATLSTR